MWLISDGKDTAAASKLNAHAVELLGVDASGENVFFWAADPLVPLDTDTEVDYYDARVGGGFPEPPVTPLACEGDACRGAPAVPPVFGSPGSFTFAGPGNLAPITPPLVKPVVKAKPLTRAEKLAKALKSCRTKHDKRKRGACERQARKKYGPKHSHQSSKGKSSSMSSPLAMGRERRTK